MKLYYFFLLSLSIMLLGCGDDSPSTPQFNPVASFSFTGSTIAPATITFINDSEDADTYYWDFGDGSSSTLETPTHTYSSPNTYRVLLVASHSEGETSDTAQTNITISPPQSPDPISLFTFSGDSVAPTTITFINQSSHANSYYWDFGDGRTSIQDNPALEFQIAGTFIVTLVASNTATSKSDTSQKTLIIVEPDIPDPIASFDFSGNNETPATISFNNQSENADTYAWDFGDGRSSIQENPTITFEDYGTYTVTLVATNSGTNISDSETQSMTILPGKVIINTVTLHDLPLNGWDLATGPDVYFILKDETDETHLTGSVILNVTSNDLPVGWSTGNNPYEITRLSLTYHLYVYDEDDFDADDYIGLATFTFDNAEHPSSITATSGDNAIRFTLGIGWE